MIREALSGEVEHHGAYPWVLYGGPHDGLALGHIPPGYLRLAGTACVWHTLCPASLPILAGAGTPAIVAWMLRRGDLV